MPAKLSKFSIDVGCKEYAHPWTNSCISTMTGIGLHSLQESLRIYSTVYIITLLMKGKIPSKDDIVRTILGILQSTAFLSWSAFSYSMFICFLIRILGNVNILTASFIPSFLSSLTAILIERPSRRTLLCLYVSNIAVETLFNMGVWRGYFGTIPYGQVYIFAASIAVLLYFYRSRAVNKDSIYRIIRFVVGPYEQSQYLGNENTNPGIVTSSQSPESTCSSMRRKSKRHTFNIIWKSFEVYKQIINNLKHKSRNPSCPHPYSCAHYILTGGAKLFSIGMCAHVAIQVFLQSRKIFTKPKYIKDIIFKKKSLNIATFLGGFAALYKLTSCSLRRIYNKDSSKFAIPASLIASTAFIAFPNKTLALYFMWKTLQLVWNDGVEKGMLPEVKWFSIFLYSFSTAVLFHAAIIEPHNLRLSYWKFMYNLSGGRVAVMSRIPLNEFGLNTYKSLQEVLKKTNTTDKHHHNYSLEPKRFFCIKDKTDQTTLFCIKKDIVYHDNSGAWIL
ncbi:hypothetical protein KPH14_002784 [Odynerus spinipes]|uniref:Transmembrane protein 135 N-terminal domain-containing protein n=1 Tax=Odynerus spinipes TaxID=1348599 RepID=A0AAD9RMW4_9HYME|nr:hypothetical protein KPH14_002784 [Odynerus spinipes]